MHLATVSVIGLAAGLCVANAAPIRQVLLAQQTLEAMEMTAFQASIRVFSHHVTEVQSILNSSGMCPAGKKLPDLQKKHKSFQKLTQAWTKSTSLRTSRSAPKSLLHKNTQLFELEVAQLGNELSTALVPKPADAIEGCLDNPHLELLNLNLEQFATRLSSYDAFLSRATRNETRAFTTSVSPSQTVSVDASAISGAVTKSPPTPSAAVTAVPDPGIAMLFPVVTLATAPQNIPATVSTPTHGLPLIVDHTTSNKLKSRSTTGELVTALGLLAEDIIINTITSPVSTSLTAALAIPGNKNNPSYSFDRNARNNVAVYYGQTELTASTSLADQCADPDINIVLLSFLNTISGPSGFPSIDLGPACKGQTVAQQSQAPGLLTCPSLAADITSCQNMGKKVFLSIGGSVAQTSFPNDAAAETFAQKLWDLFGGGTGYSNDLRPFGAVKLDGFDIDNESHSQTGYTAFASTLRSLFKSDSSKTYFISAAPQCVYPDASIPLSALAFVDFVFVQFYNNECAMPNTTSFTSALKQWSAALAAQNNSTKIYIGLLGWQDGGMGYVNHDALRQGMQAVKQANLPNLGGIMLWDGPMARANMDNSAAGADAASYVRAAKGSLKSA